MKSILFVLLVTTTNGYTQTPSTFSKENDNIFHPTSKTLMREFELDRPDVTESPYTVDAGHFQLETDLFKTERSNIKEIKIINNYFNIANLKLGITRSLDVQLVAVSLSISKIKDSNTNTKETRFGGLTVRAKKNIWGNDKGKTALAVLPFINFPATSLEKISGGVVFPFAMSLPGGWGFGAQFETVISNENGNNYHFDFLVSATVSHSIFKDLDFFVETAATSDTEIRVYEYFLNGGLLYAISNNINIDCGAYYGIKNSSSKTYFIGFSFRL